MLKKKERLTKQQFDRFFSSGRRYHSPNLTLIFTRGTVFHGAVVVGKKVAKKATARNKIRRRVYSALYALMRTEGLTGVYIVLAKTGIECLGYRDINNELTELIGQTQKAR